MGETTETPEQGLKILFPSAKDVREFSEDKTPPKDSTAHVLSSAGLPDTPQIRAALKRDVVSAPMNIAFASKIIKQMENDTSKKDVETITAALILMDTDESLDLVEEFGTEIASSVAQLKVLNDTLQDHIDEINIENLPLPLVNCFIGILAGEIDQTTENVASGAYLTTPEFLEQVSESLGNLGDKIPQDANSNVKQSFANSFNGFSMRSGTMRFFTVDKSTGSLKKKIALPQNQGRNSALN